MRVCLWTAALLLGACTTTTQFPKSTDQGKAASINLQLGVGYLQQGELARAQEKLLRARDLDPRNPDVHGALGLLDEKLGKVEDADKEYRTALDLAPHNPAMLNSYAVYLCSHSREAEGVKYFQEAASNPLYRTPWVAYTNAGYCLRTVHKDAQAQDLLQLAVRTNPSYAEATFQLADLSYEQQQFGQARVLIDAFLLRNPPTPDLLLLGWRCAGAQSDQSGRERYAVQLINNFPHSDQAHAVVSNRADAN